MIGLLGRRKGWLLPLGSIFHSWLKDWIKNQFWTDIHLIPISRFLGIDSALVEIGRAYHWQFLSSLASSMKMRSFLYHVTAAIGSESTRQQISRGAPSTCRVKACRLVQCLSLVRSTLWGVRSDMMFYKVFKTCSTCHWADTASIVQPNWLPELP